MTEQMAILFVSMFGMMFAGLCALAYMDHKDRQRK